MTALVIGKTGQVARALAERAASHNMPCRLVGRDELDLGRAFDLRPLLKAIRPAIVVNAAAYTAVDNAEDESELAFAVNRDGPARLAAECARAKLPLIHISTDYVFDGEKQGPYREDDACNPVGVYGRTKLAGETAVRECLDHHYILRTSWVYAPEGRNFMLTMLRNGKQRDILSVVDDQTGAPTAASDIADVILAIAARFDRAETLPFGTYHACNSGSTTWCRFAKAIFDQSAPWYGRIPVVTPIATRDYPTRAVRPRNSVLDCGKLKAQGIKLRDWQEALKSVLEVVHRRDRGDST